LARPDDIDDDTLVLKRGAAIGRYVVLGRVGFGAMGEVYGAYDPELDRKLAIKLLRVRNLNGTAGDRNRLLREARAIARLSHPNIVVVHDVGSIGDRVFIAMEFVEGTTLRVWMHAEPRRWRDVLRVFVAAGRGLECAHAAGLVHRDFKPENVMVGRDGRVRVMDFGLVRLLDMFQPDAEPAAEAAEAEEAATTAADAPAAAPTDPLASTGIEPDNVDATLDLSKDPAGALRRRIDGTPSADPSLTDTGAMLGTPAYMSPEQFQGKLADASSDQFSFCVALYEALYDQRPFKGSRIPELAQSLLNEEPKPPPENSAVPTWIRRATRRGLSRLASDRHPSMKELLLALEREPGSRRRQIALGAATAVALVVGGVALRGAAIRNRATCQAPMQRFEGVWEPAGPQASRRTAIEAAFRATGRSYAGAVTSSVGRVLDKFVADWSAMYRDACEATNLRGSQSAEILDLRMSCLNDRFDELRALSDVLVAPGNDVLENATEAAMGLAPLDRCANPRLLRGIGPAPAAPAQVAAIQVVRADLAAAAATEDAGKPAAAIAALFNVVANARETGYRPLLAESQFRLGMVFVAGSDGPTAEPYLTDAVWNALAGRHDELLIEAASALISVRGSLAGDLAGAELWRRFAEAALDRIDGSDRLRGRAMENWAAALAGARRFDEALKAYQEALGHLQRASGQDHLDLAPTLTQIAGTYSKLGRFREALAFNDRALAIAEAALGRDHPRLGKVLLNRAEIMSGLGRYGEAKDQAERSYGLWVRNFGSAHPSLALPLSAIGIAEVGLGHPQQAVQPLTEALALGSGGKVPLASAETRFALSQALWVTPDRQPEAIALARAALREEQKVDRPTVREQSLRAAMEQWCAHVAPAGAGRL
jgi:serine/threonine protein kinase/tetratricopeptide (TPR) repeat protein